jgi:DNA-binding transcriptional regulator LsrR (DeoR family)
MANTPNTSKIADAERMVDLIERLGAIALYLQTDMDHHSIARRLGMGTQRVTAILKGLKKGKHHG